MRRVVICTPSSNMDYKKEAVLHCLQNNDSPICIAIMSMLADTGNKYQRRCARHAACLWIKSASAMVVYTDHGIDSDMVDLMREADAFGVPVEYRKIGGIAE